MWRAWMPRSSQLSYGTCWNLAFLKRPRFDRCLGQVSFAFSAANRFPPRLKML
jgi:hypothetical protein